MCGEQNSAFAYLSPRQGPGVLAIRLVRHFRSRSVHPMFALVTPMTAQDGRGDGSGNSREQRDPDDAPLPTSATSREAQTTALKHLHDLRR